MYKENDRIKGTYSKLPFTGTVYHVDNSGYIYVVLDTPYHRNLPVGKIRSMIPVDQWSRVESEEIPVLCSFRPTDQNITLEA